MIQFATILFLHFIKANLSCKQCKQCNVRSTTWNHVQDWTAFTWNHAHHNFSICCVYTWYLCEFTFWFKSWTSKFLIIRLWTQNLSNNLFFVHRFMDHIKLKCLKMILIHNSSSRIDCSSNKDYYISLSIYVNFKCFIGKTFWLQ